MRLTVHALCLLLLAATTGQGSVRYDCRVTGVKNQPSCCCVETTCHPAQAETQCGCCDVRYQDDTPDVAETKSRTAQDGGILVVGQLFEASIVLADPFSVATHSIDDHPDLPSRGPGRHILFCSFLC